MDDLTGRTALITGGAQGIGLGMARAFAAAGMKVALADIDEAALAVAEAELAACTETLAVRLDVRDEAEFRAAAATVEQALGPVSVLCNNAGVFDGVHATRTDRSHWDWVMGVNLTGVFNGVLAFLPGMVERGEGHIVNTASAAGLAVVGGESGWLYYASKFGVVGLSEALRTDVGPLGIGVTILCPGAVATGIIGNSTKQRPPSSPPPLTEESGRANDWLAPWLARGTSPDEVGRMVRDAIVANQLYVHTDGVMAEFIAARTDALLAAIPERSQR